MAEYIDREQLLELINENCKYKNPTNEYTRGCNEVCDWAIKTIKNIPTTDVVPRSEIKKIFKELDKLTYRLLNDADYTMGDIVYDITELKNKYIGEK